MEVVDSESLLDAIGKYCDDLEYQVGNKHRIGALLSLKDVCSYYESKHFLSDLEESGYPKTPVTISSFFGHVKTVCEQSLMFFICSEISNSVQARPIAGLLTQILNEGHYGKKILIQEEPYTLSRDSLSDSLDCLNDLFVNRYDQTVGSHILDFQVSIFSAFEYWITKISENYGNEMTEKYTLSRLRKYRKYLDEYEKASSEEEKNKHLSRLRSVPGNFISFPDKFNFVINKASEKNYPRDLRIDKDIVDFIRSARNTVHNGGVHKGNDIELVHKEVTHKLIKNKPTFHEDYNDLIDLCASLVDIYESIITVLKNDLDKKSLRDLSTEV
ncbi:hypothetical protein [Vibrio sp. MEBiC08052]|uniref:hypothetical protein n=1 Tax=Vibrio sp. MEBiC08052 TaxID=1761910 RepID=UPI0007406BA7|nr:hypothetical protein [Vibrio sp. MEBiC08052]KUI99149.1 hypothetical protein VRK_19230 [Vibrio sp. MEBiC08052]